jgi:hypothetical protein
MYKHIVIILHVSDFFSHPQGFNKEKDSNGYLCHRCTMVDLWYKYYRTGSVCISITLRCVHETVVAAEKQKVLHILGVSVVLGMQHAMHVHHAIHGLSVSPVFCHIISWHNFLKRVIERKMCVSIFSTTFVWNLSHSKKKYVRWSKMCIALHLKCPFSCQVLMKLEFLWQIFKNCSDIKFHENPSSWSRVFPCSQTDVMKLSII